MSEAAIYLRRSLPSQTVRFATYQAAKRAVEQHGALPVPLHLRNAPTKLDDELGYGKDYKQTRTATPAITSPSTTCPMR